MGQNPASTPAPSDAPPRQQAKHVLRAEAAAVTGVIGQLDEQFDRAVQLILNCRGNVLVGGLGKSGIIARKISATFASTGTPSHFLHPTEAMHGDLGRIRAEDLLLLLSYGGQTDEVLALAALVRQDGVNVIAITGRADCHLARIADCALRVGDVTEACTHQLAPTASTTAMLALGDALALTVSAASDFSADDFAKRHPGGSLGRMMMPITQVLRFKARQNLPLVRDDQTVERVLHEAAKNRRAGAVLLVDSAGKLSGIFTDADLRRRLIDDGPAALALPVAEVMTAHPRRLNRDALVRDAVQMVREHRVDELPVVDADDQPVGLIDVQDLMALKVIEE